MRKSVYGREGGVFGAFNKPAQVTGRGDSAREAIKRVEVKGADEAEGVTSASSKPKLIGGRSYVIPVDHVTKGLFLTLQID